MERSMTLATKTSPGSGKRSRTARLISRAVGAVPCRWKTSTALRPANSRSRTRLPEPAASRSKPGARSPVSILASRLALLPTQAALHQRVADGDDEEGEERRGDQAAYHGDGQAAGDQGATPAAEPEGQRHESEDGRERGHQDRPQTRPSCLVDGPVHRVVAFAGVLGEVHEQDRVRDDDAYQQEHPEQRREAQGCARHEQRAEGPGRREGNRQQDDERRDEGAEKDDQDQVHQHERHGYGEEQIPEALLDVLALAPNGGGHPIGKVERRERGVYLARDGAGVFRGDGAADGHGPVPVRPADGRGRLDLPHLGHVAHGLSGAEGQPPYLFDGIYGALRQPDGDGLVPERHPSARAAEQGT